MFIEWKKNGNGLVLTKKFKSMFPMAKPLVDSWRSIPKVDMAIAKLSKCTLVPADDGSSCRTPLQSAH